MFEIHKAASPEPKKSKESQISAVFNNFESSDFFKSWAWFEQTCLYIKFWMVQKNAILASTAI